MYKRYQSSWLKDIAAGLNHSIVHHKPYYRETEPVEVPIKSDYTTQSFNPVTAKIIIVIDSGNVSAALGFIDELKIMSAKVTLVGQKTKADRLYMEVRTVELPSKLGTFAFPIKVYRNRLRADNEPYNPDFEHQTTDTEKLQKFIFKIIDNKAIWNFN